MAARRAETAQMVCAPVPYSVEHRTAVLQATVFRREVPALLIAVRRQAALLTIVRRQVVGHRRAALPIAVRRRAAVRHRVDFHLLPPVVEEEASLAEADVAADADDSCATDLYVVKNLEIKYRVV